MEKSYSVAVEMADGGKRTLAVQGASSGGVFQQVKAMPGVRRVGKVSEESRTEIVAPLHRNAAAVATLAQPVEREQKADDRRAAIGFTITGPRVVMRDRQTVGERPFKHLQAPPERPKPPASLIETVLRRMVEPSKPKHGILEDIQEPVSKETEYRIVKSRRRGGEPYLLQRGCWNDIEGKRAFVVGWEKGFEVRDKAEQHQKWVRQTEQELAEVDLQC